ncbi:MAG: beta-ketoacyl synthase chain length factor [Bacteroidales bacterium]
MYIKSIAHISLQIPFSKEWIESPLHFEPMSYNRAQDPNIKEWIAPMVARRMSPIVKRAIITAKVALQKANKKQVDAIICGTGLGCVENTEKFLDTLVRNGEQFLQPTHFIQSTHNTIASQIALLIGCNGYNSTYVHRGVSFESALLDGFLQFRLGKIESALIGGHEEITPNYFKMLCKINYWRDNAFAGEGGVSFVVDNEKKNAIAKISAVQICNNPEKITTQAKQMIKFASAVMLGISGDRQNDKVYADFMENYGVDIPQYSFKNLCGEYFTASAFGFYAAAQLLNTENLDNILFYNHYQNRDHALILLEKC